MSEYLSSQEACEEEDEWINIPSAELSFGAHACLLLLWLLFLPFSQGSRQKPCPDSPPDQMVLSPAEDAPPPGEQEELHYASLNFHEMTSREPQDQEATSTEYSEIKTS